MKIGILTFHNAHNYGAVLQAYALRTKLRAMGHKVKIINYRNPQIEAAYKETLAMPTDKYSLRHPRAWKTIWQARKQVQFAQPAWERQCRKFKVFIENVLLENDMEQHDRKDLEHLDMDVFICGSDQIWTSWLTGGLDEVYFLDFKTSAKKASYGASKFSTDFTEEERKYFQKTLNDFVAVSVREQSLADVLQNMLQCDVSTVLDPTLLLEAKDYQDLECNVELPEKYILAYFVTEDENLMKCAQHAAEKSELPLLEIHYYERRNLKGHYQTADLGPQEFLTYLKQAHLIFTNSFHGLVFSIIYHKDFYGVYEKDARKDNLMKQLQLEDRHIQEWRDIDIEKRIQYEQADELLNKLRLESEDFLKRVEK